MKTAREQWGTRGGFILAAIGSAIGLGNIWRFPYMAYENGGGAFFIPYLFAMLTAGIPLLILEFGLGHRYKGSAPKIFASISRKWEWVGWWQIFVSFIISLYYVVIIGWSIVYFFLSFSQGWGSDTGNYFMHTFLDISDSPLHPGGIRWPIFAAVSFVWLTCWVVLFRGVKKGIETAGKIFMPLLFIMVLIIVGRSVVLPGAADGLNWLFTPDFSALLKGNVWIAAYGQIFYSLSIGFAIMLTYSSYLPAKSDINNNAFITAFLNCGFSILSGIMVFAVLGYMAAQQGVGVDEVVSSGVGLAFVTIPQAINLLPAPALFGSLFFLALIFAGLSSQISICEACIASLMDKFSLNRKAASTIYCSIGLIAGAFFACRSGLLALDIVDHFINNFGVLLAALTEIILISWLFDLKDMRLYNNIRSDFSIGWWWSICLKVVTPAVLGYMALQNLYIDITKAYGGYPGSSIILLGWIPVVLIVLLGVIIQFRMPVSRQQY